MKSVYLIGIGGAGLSGLARYFYHNGYRVFGADPSENETSQALIRDIDATVYTSHDADNIPDNCEMIVYSPAVPSDNPERVAAVNQGIREYSYPEYLGEISKDKYTVAIAGTNGKTTTTTMTATVLDELGLDPTVIVGGNMPRFGSNFRAGDSDYFVVEACEYKESFLHLCPNLAVITNITPDHLDYFGTVENYVQVFEQFVDRIAEDGVLVVDTGSELLRSVVARAHDRNLTVIDYTQYAQHDWNLPVPGEYNIRNAAAALTACTQLNLETSVVQKTIEGKFETADRRFQLLGMSSDGAAVYDDYAHNVEALHLLIDGVQKKYCDKKIVMVFQPHLFSRTEKFFDGFVEQLSRVDYVYLLPIYQARERPEDFAISSQSLADAIAENNSNVLLTESVDQAVQVVNDANHNADHIIICVGAGQADQVGKQLVQ